MKGRDRRAVLLIGPLLLQLLVLAATASSDPLSPDSAVPPVLEYQGVMTDAYGEQLTGTFAMTFRLYDTADGGEPLWEETLPVTITDGLFGAYLGDTSPLIEMLFDGRDLYLGISIETDSEMYPRVRLATAPYAFTADRTLSTTIVAGTSLQEGGAGTESLEGASASTLEETRSIDVAGMASATHRIPWRVLAAGGTYMVSSDYRMGSTLAQPLIGVVRSDSFRISAGYWPGARALAERRYRVHLPLVLRAW